MFGHQDDQNDHHHHDEDNQPMDNVLSGPAADDMLSNDGNGAPIVSSDFNPALPAQDDQPGADSEQATQDLPAPISADPVATTPVAPPAGDLLDIKQQALTQLSPLVDHLDQSPEEKFRTTMMMIQAADNKDLIKVAYEAAQQITDEKVKAQALLDIVNEINYFTQQNG